MVAVWLLASTALGRQLDSDPTGDGGVDAQAGFLDYQLRLAVATQQAYSDLAPGTEDWRPWDSPAPGPWWEFVG